MNLENDKPLILDGAMGSVLHNGNIDNKELWSSIVNISNPAVVQNLHLEYIKAGADIITTNTFRTNPSAVRRSKENLELKDFVEKSVESALKARNDHNVYIAGSNPPAEDCYQIERFLTIEELINNHSQHIDLLMLNGVDFVLNETQSHMDEIEIICEYCTLNNYPFIISLFFNDDLKLLSGEDVSLAIKYINKYSPLCIMFNCIQFSQLHRLLETIELNFKWGFYLNCGGKDHNESSITCKIEPKEYGVFAKKLLGKNPSIIGSCCGSSPSHTKFLREMIDELYRN
jgi:homocysteine S-methyltransferase